MSTITSTEITTAASPAHSTPTPTTTIKVNLVCEDRDTGKKCLFKDLKVTLMPEKNFKVIELIEKNISLQYFLSNSMIFQPSDDDMDIMIGFYPSEEIQNQYLSIDSKTNITLKFEKIRTPSSESKKEETLPVPANQNQISNNKNTNNNNNNNNNNNQKTNHTNPSHNAQSKSLLTLNHNGQASGFTTSSPKAQNIIFNDNMVIESQDACEKTEGTVTASSSAIVGAGNNTSAQLLLGNAATASQLSNEDLNNNDSLTLSSHSLPMESEGCSQQIEPSAVSNNNNNDNASNVQAASENQQRSIFAAKNEGCETAKGFQLNRKRKVSEALDHCSESCSNQNESKDLSPCTSFTENDMPKMKKHQSAITNDPTLSEAGETNNCFTNSMNLSLSGKFPINLFGSAAGLNISTHNSSFHAYNPLSNITNNSLNNPAFQSSNGCGGKSSESNGLNGFQFMATQLQQQGSSNNGNSANNNNSSNLSRQSRNKERTIREAIEMVTKWRDLQEEYRQKHQVKGLQEVADELNISKKVLDYYFQELRTAEFFGFDFDSNLGNKMGVLRKYIDEQKKNHEQKNKNFKITRNLQFKYRLKDYQGSSYLSNSSSNNNNNNNDALSSTSSQKSKEKFQQKQQAKMDQITSLLSSSVSNGQVKVEEMAIEAENNFNFPTSNNNVSGAASSTSASSATSSNVSVPPCDLQKLLSKNSPNFLQFLNNSTSTSTGNASNNFPSSVSSGSGFNLANNSNNTNNSTNSNTNSSQNNLNFLSNLGSNNNNNNSGFSINHEGLRKQNSQSQSSQQNSNNMDKNLLLLELLLNQNVQQQASQTMKQEPIVNEKVNNNNAANNQFGDLLSLLKIFNDESAATMNDLSIPSFQKSHSAQSTLMNSKFSEEDYLAKQSKLVKPQRIAVIQIRKQDE